MIKANLTIYKLYFAMMDRLSRGLSERYSESSSDNLNYYKTIIIQKIVRMFHTFDCIANEYQDEVSARCLLRGILDSVTTYCFIYEMPDIDEVLFRHFLYVLDSFDSYKNSRVVFSNVQDVEPLLDNSIEQILLKLHNLPFYRQNRNVADRIIKKINWKYESLKNIRSLKFKEMYKIVGFQDELATYYQEYLSQFVHGLCFSNVNCLNLNQVKILLCESLPIIDRLMHAIYKTFQEEELIKEVCSSAVVQELINSPNFNIHDLGKFLKDRLLGDTSINI